MREAYLFYGRRNKEKRPMSREARLGQHWRRALDAGKSASELTVGKKLGILKTQSGGEPSGS